MAPLAAAPGRARAAMPCRSQGRREKRSRGSRRTPQETRKAAAASAAVTRATPPVNCAPSRAEPDWKAAIPQTPATRARTVADAHPAVAGERLGLPAQHPRRRHAQHGRERRQAEQQRDPHPEPQAPQQGGRLPGADQRARDQVREEMGEHELDGDAGEDAHQAAGEPEQDRLPEIEGEDLARAHPQAFEDRDGVQPAGEPGPHALGHPDAAHEERQQGDQPQEPLHPGDVPLQGGLRLAVGLDAVDLAAGEGLLQPLGGGVERGGGGARPAA